MEGKTEYAVLKLAENHGRCYVSTDCVEGTPLIYYLKYRPGLDKELLFAWMKELARMIGRFHRCRGNPCYQYLTPYSVIVNEEGGIYLLDFGSQESEELRKKIQSRAVRENFQMPDNRYYQRTSVEDDMYSLGRVYQYMAAVTEPSPPFTRKEQRKLKKIISKCLCQNPGEGSEQKFKHPFQKNYQNFQELSEQFSKKQVKKTGKNIKKFLAVAAGVLFAALCLRKVVTTVTEQRQPEIRKTETKPEISKKEAELQFDLGMLYFLELKDYEESAKRFDKAKGLVLLAEEYCQLSRYLALGVERKERSIEELLGYMEGELPENDDYRYVFALFRGYVTAGLKTEESKEAVIRLGNQCLAMEEWKKKDTEHEKEKELRWNLAAVLEEEKPEEAETQYQYLLELEEREDRREQLYFRLIELYEKKEEKGKAQEVCRQAVEELKESRELRIRLIQMYCADESVERSVCAQYIQQSLQELPEIAAEEGFLKLQNEYGIQIEGEQVWVGR